MERIDTQRGARLALESSCHAKEERDEHAGPGVCVLSGPSNRHVRPSGGVAGCESLLSHGPNFGSKAQATACNR